MSILSVCIPFAAAFVRRAIAVEQPNVCVKTESTRQTAMSAALLALRPPITSKTEDTEGPALSPFTSTRFATAQADTLCSVVNPLPENIW
jgi:hypothetical protein